MNNVSSVTVPFRLNQHAPLILVPAHVNGHGPVDAVVDTGASVTVISPEVAHQAGISLDGPTSNATGADGSHSVVMTDLAQLKIGGLQVENLKVAVMDLAHVNQKARMNAGVILGYGFLRRYEVTINYADRWIRFSPFEPR